MSNVKRLLIRADADQSMGTGHVMRCLVLAAAWRKQGGEVLFVSSCQQSSLVHRIQQVAEFYPLKPENQDLQQTLELVKHWQPAYCILDGYHFDPSYQQQLYQTTVKLLLLDDMAHHPRYYADIILNQNFAADRFHYQCPQSTQLLLGLKYALLRSEFIPFITEKKTVPLKARNLLITLGGSDPDNVTLRVVEALRQLNHDWAVKIIVGAANPHSDILAKIIGDGRHYVLLKDVKNMAELMVWADMAVSAAGSTVWELLAIGVPTSVIILAENQRHIAEQLAQQNVVINLGKAQKLNDETIRETMFSLAENSEKRLQMVVKGQEMVRPNGADRVLRALKQSAFSLRKTRYKDAELLWQWANDRNVRQTSFHSAPIPWERHKAWLQQKLLDKNALLLLACDDAQKPFAQVRFDLEKNVAVISVSINKEYRGKGYACWLIKQAIKEFMHYYSVTSVLAFIKVDNRASRQSFAQAGFTLHKTVMHQGFQAEQWQLDLNHQEHHETYN